MASPTLRTWNKRRNRDLKKLKNRQTRLRRQNNKARSAS